MSDFKDFRFYSIKHHGISSLAFDEMYSPRRISNYAPYVLAEGDRSYNIYSLLLKERIVFLGYPIDDEVASAIQAQLLYLESQDPDKDIFMYINSPGGVVSSGLGIYDTMQYVRPDVSTICVGMAASMGAVLLAAGHANKRTALPHARVMIHQPLGGAQGSASDIEITAKEIQRVKTGLYDILSLHSKKPVEQIVKDADRDYWLSAEEAKEYGLIDEILVRTKKKEK